MGNTSQKLRSVKLGRKQKGKPLSSEEGIAADRMILSLYKRWN